MVKYQVWYYILVQSGKVQTVQSPKNFGICFLPSYETEVYRETNSQKKKETGQDFWKFLTFWVFNYIVHNCISGTYVQKLLNII